MRVTTIVGAAVGLERAGLLCPTTVIAQDSSPAHKPRPTSA